MLLFAITFAATAKGPARAEVPEVKIVAQNGTNYLPLFVMQGQKLVEKHLAAKGRATTTVGWTRLSSPAAIVDSFLAGAVHFAGQGVPSSALLWDRTRNGIGVKAVSALVSSNIWLMTRKPELKSISDLTDRDRIALPSIKSSAQALGRQALRCAKRKAPVLRKICCCRIEARRASFKVAGSTESTPTK